jgi:6,7-dimethyl-8-ribityllumazine synthase
LRLPIAVGKNQIDEQRLDRVDLRLEFRMSKTVPPRPSVIDGKRTFIIVASQFNAHYVEGLVDHAKKELRALAPNAAIAVQRVPGAFEIPVIVRELAAQAKADAIIACGVILRGKTNHAQNLSRSVTDALQRIAIDYGVPVINAVLSFENETQARERCLEDKINRGTEAARAAVEMARVMSELRGK